MNMPTTHTMTFAEADPHFWTWIESYTMEAKLHGPIVIHIVLKPGAPVDFVDRIKEAAEKIGCEFTVANRH